jgi:hypothetical protein
MSQTPATSAGPIRAPALILAAIGPVAVGGILVSQSATATPLLAVPALVFGVVAATAPALYIASAASGGAPSLSAVVRAFGVALGAFGIALAGLLLPAAFLSLSSTAAFTTFVVASAALGGAGFLGLRRLGRELAGETLRPSLASSTVFVVWSAATVGIAGRLWWDLAKEVLS